MYQPGLTPKLILESDFKNVLISSNLIGGSGVSLIEPHELDVVHQCSGDSPPAQNNCRRNLNCNFSTLNIANNALI